MAATLYSRFTAVMALSLITACASAPSANQESYSNILVLAISDNYSNRAHYERSVAAELRRLGAAATPYYEAVSGSGDISREKAQELIAENGFDAVLVTRVLQASTKVDVEQDSAAVKTTRKDGRPINFFRYDYEEMNEPGAMNLLSEGQLDTDLHRATDGEIVWSYSWNSSSAENVGALIDASSSEVVKRLNRDKLIGM